MFFERGCILLLYLTLVAAGYFPKDDWSLDVDGKLKESNSMTNEIPTNVDDNAVWSQVTVVKMHYDCRGRLMRQEVARVKTRTGDNTTPIPETPGTGYSEGGVAFGAKVEEAPVYFRSMKERFKTPRTTTQIPVERTTSRSKIQFLPDKIIDVPIRSCPEGQNEDYFGECRPVFQEVKQ